MTDLWAFIFGSLIVLTFHPQRSDFFHRANRAQFLEVSLRSFKSEDEAPRVALPSVLGDEDEQELEELDVAMDNLNTGPSDKDQLEKGLISLSALPRSKWQTLLNLDTIKVHMQDPCMLSLSNHSLSIVAQ